MTRHTSRSSKDDLMSLLDIVNDIGGGIGVMALPFLVAVPGLIALLGLGLVVVLPLLAVGLALAILSLPLAGIWWLLHLLRRTRGRET